MTSQVLNRAAIIVGFVTAISAALGLGHAVGQSHLGTTLEYVAILAGVFAVTTYARRQGALTWSPPGTRTRRDAR
jgi:hypothetical protein